MSLVTRQPTRKHEFKCHLDISQVENCLLSNFDLNDPHGTHCHRLDCDATFLSNISRLMHTHTHSQWLHATVILGGVQKKFHAIGMRIRWQDGLKGNKAPKDWEEGETRETWGRSALVLTDSSPRLLSRDRDHFALPPPCKTIFGLNRARPLGVLHTGLW